MMSSNDSFPSTSAFVSPTTIVLLLSRDFRSTYEMLPLEILQEQATLIFALYSYNTDIRYRELFNKDGEHPFITGHPQQSFIAEARKWKGSEYFLISALCYLQKEYWQRMKYNLFIGGRSDYTPFLTKHPFIIPAFLLDPRSLCRRITFTEKYLVQRGFVSKMEMETE